MQEDALRAYLNRRCRRAYAHDLRNGLQGIFGGVDALTRAARSIGSGRPLTVPLEQLTTFVQQAIANHERALERVLENIAPEANAPAPVSCREMLIELARFLANDAARNSVRIRQDFQDDLNITTVVPRLQLIGLALLTDSIDALAGGGEIRMAGRTADGRVQFEIIDTRPQPRPASFVSDTIERLVAALSGRIESKQSNDGGIEVRVELPVG